MLVRELRIVSNELLYKKSMSRTYNTRKEVRQKKLHRCRCGMCRVGVPHRDKKQRTIKEGMEVFEELLEIERNL